MKKLYFLLLIALTIGLQACKNSEDAGPDKTYLVSSITTHYASYNEVKSFTYDDKNRLATASFTGSFDFRYTYDGEDRLSSVVLTDKKGLAQYTYKFGYENIIVHVKYTVVGAAEQNHTMELANGQVYKYSTSDTDYTVCNHDDRGNMTEYRAISIHGTEGYGAFTYDDKKSPFAMVKGYEPFLAFGMNAYYSTANNQVSNSALDTTTTYAYNSAGFPISAVVKVGGANVKVDYKYIVK